MKKLLILSLLCFNFQLLFSFIEPTFREHISTLDDKTQPNGLRKAHEALEKNMYASHGSLCLKSVAVGNAIVSFFVAPFSVEISTYERLNGARCTYDVLNADIQYLDNKDSVFREKLIQDFAARYEECVKLGQDIRKRVDTKK